VHEALKALLSSATKSVVVSMYGYDDDELDAVLRDKLESDKIFVQMSLDKTQAAGVHEKQTTTRTTSSPSSGTHSSRRRPGTGWTSSTTTCSNRWRRPPSRGALLVPCVRSPCQIFGDPDGCIARRRRGRYRRCIGPDDNAVRRHLGAGDRQKTSDAGH
jgi:hypothetical protein